MSKRLQDRRKSSGSLHPACCALADAERCGATLIQSVRADNLARGDRRCTRRATTQSGLCHQHALYEAKHEWCFPCGTKRGEKCWGHCVGTSWHNAEMSHSAGSGATETPKGN